MNYKLQINNFRGIQNEEIFLGNKVTIISGRNSTGKSTILGMLGNSGELKKVPKTCIKKKFRAPWSELFTGSPSYDKSGSNKYEVFILNDDGTIFDSRTFRITWQKKKKEGSERRFHIVPSNNITEAKMSFPVIFLGLSRLFPLGEADQDGIKEKEAIFTNEDSRDWFKKNYTEILSIHDTINSIREANINEVRTKKVVGINTDTYDYRGNSSGQDNLGQILMAMLYLRDLAEKQPIEILGLLLIDEIDATLHPVAQNRLIDLFYRECKKYNYKVVLTTHSLSLLEYCCSKTYNNRSDCTYNDYELYYFTKANRKLQVKRNCRYEMIKNDLLVQASTENSRKIKVYLEDDEARWFFKKLCNQYIPSLNIRDIKIGCQSLISLYLGDSEYFKNILFVLDGDFVYTTSTSEENKSFIKGNSNLIQLPIKAKREAPEKVFYNFIINLPSDNELWNREDLLTQGYSWDYFKEQGPTCTRYTGNEREKYKTWFNEHLKIFEDISLFEIWAKENSKIVTEFREDFIHAYNAIAKRLTFELLEK